MRSFVLKSDYSPAGDQTQAMEKLSRGLNGGLKHQVLLGVTGSGKTYTMAKVIEKTGRPALVISHNKTLAAQLAQEYQEFFPENAVAYFVSYYDYYQPEAYIPQRDQYIEKEADINQEIDRLRLLTTASLLTREDVIVVASVSCIYNLGSPIEYGRNVLELSIGLDPLRGLNPLKTRRDKIMKRLIDLFYDRRDFDFRRSTFRVRGELIDVWPAHEINAVRLEFNLDDSLKSLNRINPVTGESLEKLQRCVLFPAKHYISNRETYARVFTEIRVDLEKRVFELKRQDKDLEAHRLKQRTEYDLEMIQNIGSCRGIENYSRYFDGRRAGDPPFTLLDYFDPDLYPPLRQGFGGQASDPRSSLSRKRDWLLIIDESHITVPQIRGMYNGDRARKEVLIDYGFRLPSALDNRPLRFDEFLRKIPQTIYTSATPGDWEISQAEGLVVEQLLRPTGLLDPEIDRRPTKGQIGDLIKEIESRVERRERVLVTTLTKDFAEELANYLKEKGIKVQYLHADVATLERSDILDDLRRGHYDVVVGINLLREGLDLPEVSLVAILDADKEGFLRSKTSLIQTMGRAARHINGRVIMYADEVTLSMQAAIEEVGRRRLVQRKYNQEHGITPRTVTKPLRRRLIEKIEKEERFANPLPSLPDILRMNPRERKAATKNIERAMKEAAEFLDFELAARYRDLLREIKLKSNF